MTTAHATSSPNRISTRLMLSKLGDARFLGHLDFARLVERSLRRSGLPVRHTEGFNPHMKVTFADALPVGVASMGEWVTVTLSEDLAPDDVRARLAPALPGSVELVDVRQGIPPQDDGSVRYRLDVIDGRDSAASALDALLASDSHLVKDARRGRTLDVRPHLLRGELGERGLTVTLVAVDGRPPRPGPLMQALVAIAEQRDEPAPRFGLATRLVDVPRHGDTTWHDDAEVPPGQGGSSSSSTHERPKRAASPS